MTTRPLYLWCAALLICFASAEAQVQPIATVGPTSFQSSTGVVLSDGTPIRLSLEQALDSARAEVGETIYFRVVDDVRLGNVVAIPGGSTATGHIVADEHKKSLGRGGKLEFSIDYVKSYNNDQVKVRATAGKQGKDSTGKVITFTVLVSPLFLLLHGKDAVIPQGTTVTAYVDGKQEIPLSLAAVSAGPVVIPSSSLQQPGGGADPPPSSRNSPNDDSCSITLTSEPTGVEISIDGDFAGNTPSTLKLKGGHHTIKAVEKGFKDWERNLTVNSGGSITVNISMESLSK